MKNLTWQLVTVIGVSVVGLVAMIAFLSAAGWSEGGIAGMVTGIGAVATSIIVQVKGQQTAAERMTELDRKTDTIVAQTNGLADHERQDIASRAATEAVRKVTG